MSSVVVVGGSVAGLIGALAIARDGHHVTILEKDPVPLPPTPDEAFDAWTRRGSPQVRHSHAFLGRMHNLIRDREPQLLERLLSLGAEEITFESQARRYFDNPVFEPGDKDATLLACRRVTFEWALRQHVAETGLVEYRDGMEVTGLAARPGHPPQVTGVLYRKGDGPEQTLAADLVVVANGRRTHFDDWLEAIGAPRPRQLRQPCGIYYSTRFYRLNPGVERPSPDAVIGADFGYIKCGIFPGDNRTFSVTLAAAPEDDEIKAILGNDGFDAAARSLPVAWEWVRPEVSTPISDVAGMGDLNDVRRFMVEDGEPIVLGAVAIGDALAHANPVTGRGCTLAWVAAYALAAALASHPDDLRGLVLELEAAVEREAGPWVRAQIAADKDAALVNEALRESRDPYSYERADGTMDMAAYARSVVREGLLPGTREDIHLMRAFMRVAHMLSLPEGMLADPGLAARVLESHARHDGHTPTLAGPSRAEMVELLAHR